MKTAIIILSDPKSGSDEAKARVLNALAMADECRRAGDELEIAFAGAGTRWPAELSTLWITADGTSHAVREHVAGASRSCALANDATAGVQAAGVALVGDNEVAGTPGVLSIRRYFADGWNVALF
jgi:hypothetical protein